MNQESIDHMNNFYKWRKFYTDNGFYELVFDWFEYSYDEVHVSKHQALVNMTRSIVWYDRSVDQ